MKINSYYAGHEFQWIQHFLDAIPEKYVKAIGFSIAAAIHHQYTYKKSNKFSLPHSIQKIFGIHSRSLPRYLSIFQQYNLIKFSSSIGNSFEIELLLLPNSTSKKYYKRN